MASDPPELKALRLLRSKLSPSQRACFDRHAYFMVTSKTGRLYRVWHGTDMFDGEHWYSLCVHSGMGYEHRSMPIWDDMLARKLWIESDEKTFLKKANWGLGAPLAFDGFANFLRLA